MNAPARPRRSRTRGMTLVELLIAVFLAGVIAAAGAVVYLVNQRSLHQGRDKLLTQQNATWCLESMARDARRARRVELPAPGRMVLYDIGGSVISTWELGTVNGENRLERNGVAMAPEACTTLGFSVNADSSAVGLTLELMDDAENRVRVQSQAALRNRWSEGG